MRSSCFTVAEHNPRSDAFPARALGFTSKKRTGHWISGGVDLPVDCAMDADVRRLVPHIAEMELLLAGTALDLVRRKGEKIVIHA